eukprot:5502804-Pyramimonas_sp.AAC.1
MARGSQKERLKEPQSDNKKTAIRCFRSCRHPKDGMQGPIVFAAPIPLGMMTREARRSLGISSSSSGSLPPRQEPI